MGWFINPYRFVNPIIPNTDLVFGNRCVGCDNVRKYDLLGNLIWSRNTGTVNVFGVAIDNNYNVLATGSIVNNITTRKYNSSGTLLWSVNHGLGTNAVITDSNNNVYIAGQVSTNITTRKYDSNGNLLWSVNNGSTVLTITVDSNNNVYTGGDTFNNLFTIRKYDSNGNLLLSFDTPNGSANKITIDNSNGDIYVATSSADAFNNNVWKFDSNGVFQWKFPTGGSNAYGVILDSNKNIFTVDDLGQIKKYDSNLNLIWVRNHNIELRDVKIDNQDNVYVTGGLSSSITSRKYDNDGNLIWTLNMGNISYNIAIK
jgi:hypothetical protein